MCFKAVPKDSKVKSRALLDSEELATFPVKTPTVLDNENCIYCSTELSPHTRTKEHVVGRRFVPKGKLDGGWNLIAYACSVCNNNKSRLEDEIAAISMQPDVDGNHAIEDEALRSEARRKANKSYSSKTKRVVGDSGEILTFESSHPSGLTAKVEMRTSAQVDADLIFELSRLQVCGFFYLLTFDASSRRGRFWGGTFVAINHARRHDWGNQRITSFAKVVHDWEPRLLATTAIADGYYKVAIRKHPDDFCWSWALEWNHNFRCVGFFGEEKACHAVEQSVARNTAHLIVDSPQRKLAIRREVQIVQGDDVLFRYRDIEIE